MNPGQTSSPRVAGAIGIPPGNDVPSGAAAAAAASKCRRWFRLMALLLPFFFVGLLELGLRVAGYGYATSFFLEQRNETQRSLVENPKFGWRFFPPAIARTPQPLSLAAEKPAGTIRIFVFGESAAMGDPEPAYGFPRQLERLLAARDPGRKFEVVNTAMTAINSHVIREIARDCAPRQGDFWVIYAGNNEVVGPFGAGTVFGRQASGLAVVRAGLLIKSTRLGQWLSTLQAQAADPMAWQGMEMFLHNQVREDAPGLQTVRENFARNLAAILELGRRAGATVLLATVPVNLKDSPPFASQHRSNLAAAELKQWEETFARGREAQAAGRPAEALAIYAEAGRIDAEYAELAFRRAVCELALGQTNAAIDFVRARDLDTLRFRADSGINQTIRQTAAAGNIHLIDAERECAQRSPGGIPGDALFYDHVHLNFSGNYLIAGLLAHEIGKKLANDTNSTSFPLLAEGELARQLAWTGFDQTRIAEEMRLRLRQPPFASQINQQARDEGWQAMIGRLAAAPAQFIGDYQFALSRAPGDWVLHASFGRLLDAAGNAVAAAQEWQAVTALVPQEPDAWFQLGNLAYHGRAFALAQTNFQEALKRNPALLEARNGLGLALAAQGDVAGAVREFTAVLRRAPAFSAARVNLAVALAKRGEISAALAEYHRTLELETNNVAARINLAKLLAQQGKRDEAIGWYKEALALKPDEPIANFDLANALAAQGRHDEAVPFFEAAVRAQSDFVDARFNLALEYARCGKVSEALPQFAEVVRLQPDLVEAHFNYGIALARQRRYAEAVREFQETLARQPDHAGAQAALERARNLARAQRGS